MKKAIIAIAFWAASVGAFAQGTVNFDNLFTFTTGSDPNEAAVYDVNNTTRLSGSAFLAQLYWGSASWTGTTGGTAVTTAAQPFFTTADGAAGFWNGIATTVGVAGGSPVFVQVRAWRAADGATWDIAKAALKDVGNSAVLALTAGGGGSPPSLPATLTGLQRFKLVPVPEPSTIALGIIGAGALLLRRRK